MTAVAERRRGEREDFNVQVGVKVRRLREKKSWTQARLADQAGVSGNFVARLERGEIGLSLFSASRIAGALERPVEDLVP